MTRRTVIVGDPGCGKTRNAERLGQYFRHSQVVDGYDGDSIDRLPDDCLVLTVALPPHLPPGTTVVRFEDAMRRMQH